jgi:sulfate permease, SulP family
VILAAFLVWAFDLETQGVGVVGKIPVKWPTFDLPTIHPEQFRQLTSSALALAVLGLLEAIAMAKGIAALTGQKLDVNQQCLSEGLANLVGSCFHCMPGSGSLTRSAINQQAGAVTQWSGVISAVAVLVTMLALGPLARFIPKAALAGILIVSSWRMVDRKQLVYYFKATRFDAGIVLATGISAIVISVEFCILVGVFLSFVLFVRRAARLHVSELTVTPERVIRERLPTDPPCGKILIYALEGELFFGSAHDLERHQTVIEERSQHGIRVVVLRMKRIRNPDAVCLHLLDGFIKRLNERDVTVLLCGVRHDLAKILRKTGVQDRLGSDKIFIEGAGLDSSTLNAIRHAYDLLASDICGVCPRRVELPAEPLYYMI